MTLPIFRVPTPTKSRQGGIFIAPVSALQDLAQLLLGHPDQQVWLKLEMKRSQPTFLTMASLKLPLSEVLRVMKRSDMRASLRISWVNR